MNQSTAKIMKSMFEGITDNESVTRQSSCYKETTDICTMQMTHRRLEASIVLTKETERMMNGSHGSFCR